MDRESTRERDRCARIVRKAMESEADPNTLSVLARILNEIGNTCCEGGEE